MSEILNQMKNIYTKIKEGLDWKDYYPNNDPQNGKKGIYAEFVYDNNETGLDRKINYIKLSIMYKYKVDNKGIAHPEEGIKYYLLQTLQEKDIEDVLETNVHLYYYNNHGDGTFAEVFEDEETAKAVAQLYMEWILYPYTYLLSEEESKEWNEFLDSFNK